jgi:hypothetical protein
VGVVRFGLQRILDCAVGGGGERQRPYPVPCCRRQEEQWWRGGGSTSGVADIEDVASEVEGGQRLPDLLLPSLSFLGGFHGIHGGRGPQPTRLDLPLVPSPIIESFIKVCFVCDCL